MTWWIFPFAVASIGLAAATYVFFRGVSRLGWGTALLGVLGYLLVALLFGVVWLWRWALVLALIALGIAVLLGLIRSRHRANGRRSPHAWLAPMVVAAVLIAFACPVAIVTLYHRAVTWAPGGGTITKVDAIVTTTTSTVTKVNQPLYEAVDNSNTTSNVLASGLSCDPTTARQQLDQATLSPRNVVDLANRYGILGPSDPNSLVVNGHYNQAGHDLRQQVRGVVLASTTTYTCTTTGGMGYNTYMSPGGTYQVLQDVPQQGAMVVTATGGKSSTFLTHCGNGFSKTPVPGVPIKSSPTPTPTPGSTPAPTPVPTPKCGPDVGAPSKPACGTPLSGPGQQPVQSNPCCYTGPTVGYPAGNAESVTTQQSSSATGPTSKGTNSGSPGGGNAPGGTSVTSGSSSTGTTGGITAPPASPPTAPAPSPDPCNGDPNNCG